MPSCTREARIKRVLKVLDNRSVAMDYGAHPGARRNLAAELVDAAGMPEIMGAKEAGVELDVAGYNLRKVPGLPEHEQEVSNNRLWQADIIRRFARKRRRRNDERRTHGRAGTD